eukprot:GSChrysophyteH1.ASY1.ANO1.819.1 assembled CDS
MQQTDGFHSVHPACVRVVEKDAARAASLKELGNARYKAQDFEEAIRLYGQALAYCPVDELHAHSRAVYHSNRGACFLGLRDYERVVEECGVAVELDPRYVRALMRQAAALEKLDRLDEAVAALKAAVDVDASYMPAVREYQRVDALFKEKTEKMKNEMLGKLKDLGNTILGKFGMSLDNFKLQQQEGGGYSVSFKQ